MKKLILTFFLIFCLPISTTFAVSRITSNTTGFEKKTPKINLFAVDGNPNEFVLLDEFEDGYLVIMKNYAHTRLPFDPDNTGKFDVEDENNIAYWLNNDYLNNPPSDVVEIPQKMKDYIVEREWVTEGGHPDKGFPEPYTTKCKIVLMSQTEFSKYCITERVLGTYDDTSNGYWMFRSTDSTSNDVGVYASGILVAVANSGTTGFGKAETGCGVRPMFVLSKDFFKNEKVNINKSGSIVLNILNSTFSKEELSKLYGNNIVERMGRLIVPGAKNVKIDGMNISGRTLTGNYEYFSPDAKAEKGTLFRWLRSSSKDGYYSPIKGATSQSYVTTTEDAGKYIKFEVVPQTSVNTGYPTSSDGFLLKKESLPEVYDVVLNGSGKCGEELFADYHYRDENQEPAMNVFYKWQSSEDGESFSDIEGATGESFVPTEELCGKHLRVMVKADKLGNGNYPSAGFATSPSIIVKSKPKAQNVSIVQGTTFYGNYTYSDTLNIAENDSVCAWEVSREKNGNYMTISYDKQFTPPSSDCGYYLRYSVTPVNSDGISGDKTVSDSVYMKGAENVLKADVIINPDGTLISNTPEIYKGIVVGIYTNSEALSVNSECFDVVVSGAKGEFVCVFTPKNTEVIHIKDAFAQIKADSELQLQNVVVLTL